MDRRIPTKSSSRARRRTMAMADKMIGSGFRVGVGPQRPGWWRGWSRDDRRVYEVLRR
jgi:hypothetical protein